MAFNVNQQGRCGVTTQPGHAIRLDSGAESSRRAKTRRLDARRAVNECAMSWIDLRDRRHGVRARQAGLRHEDIRPAKIVLRSAEPLDLVVTGFGSVRLSD